ncbi:hemolysin family protein [Sphingosinicella soli]|uniref:Putative hemolysin n=1 Tax=Sphingosinicella soli TaxID=333708 RepID=A0A7W7B4W8_9SPHN|nr:hemolysin family protein [Sphingosinicella soli]MBB4632972.1 putative hemolysin [Sphingosinicella soli]
MQPFPWVDIGIILLLIAVNGVFAMSEMSVVSSRRARLQAMVNAGKPGSRIALALHDDPSRFLSTVQIGITLVGIVNGAYSGATLGGPVAERLALLGVPERLSSEVGIVLVVTLITYLSLTVGELVPKQLALRSPERVAVVIAAPMSVLSRITAPLVWVLEHSTKALLRLFGAAKENADHVTAEELHLIVSEATNAGVIEENERQMISGVMRLANRSVRAVMTPRTEIDWLDIEADEAEIRAELVATAHTRLPVAEGSIDRIIGILQARDVAAAILDGRPLDVRALLRSAPVVPDAMDAADALEVLRRADVPIALVHDEYGHFEGILTPADLLAAIAGAFKSDLDEGTEPDAVERGDGSWLLAGSMPADEMAETLGTRLPAERDYQTVAGFALSVLTHLPEIGETFRYDDWTFEIVDMDGRKIDRLLATPAADPEP